MSSGSFDEEEFESFYYKGINFEDARNILLEEEEGVFLIRDSSRGGGYVICVKENSDVSQYTINVKDAEGQTTYFIREEFPFKSLPTLLAFYKRNIFKTTSLTRPIADERVILRRTSREGCERGYIKSEIPADRPIFVHGMRHSAPPDMAKPYDTDNHPPLYARVIKAREPRSYTKRDLKLEVNDLIRVTSRNSGQGIGTGELNGKIGDFPLINVEFVSKPK